MRHNVLVWMNIFLSFCTLILIGLSWDYRMRDIEHLLIVALLFTMLFVYVINAYVLWRVKGDSENNESYLGLYLKRKMYEEKLKLKKLKEENSKV